MKNKHFTVIAVLTIIFYSQTLSAQKYLTKNGTISFFSDAPLEKIEAVNKQVNAALDISSGDIVFKVLMKSFEFEKALMQEHFNENYVESDKFPNATFVGKIGNISSIDFSKSEKHDVTISGKMTIHGVTKDISEKGQLEIAGDMVTGTTTFMIKLGDYDISIPNTVVNNISENIEIKVDVRMKKI